MDELLKLFLAVSISCCVLVGLVTYSSIKDNEAMLEMVKNGADPLKASCAVKGSTKLNDHICFTLVK